jgi:hypothetical protein
VRRAATVALVATLALAACGESAEDEALDRVCAARSSIDDEVQRLQGLTPETGTADAVRGSFEAIQDDLRTIAEARPELSEERREEVRDATDAFVAQVREVGATVLRSISVEDARTQLATATDELAGAYRETVASIDCD